MARLPLLPLLLALALPGDPQEVQQSPPYALAPEGGSISITCRTRGPLSGVYLLRSQPRPSNVAYFETGKAPTVDAEFGARVAFSGLQDNLTITLGPLRPADTGAYVCRAIMKDSVSGPGTLVVVTDELVSPKARCSGLLAAMAVGSFLAGLGLGVASVQIRKLWSRRSGSSANVIYVDMAYSRRPCAPAGPSQ
nr:T-cell antigen CD7 [Dasypus novemcinctus]